MLSVQINFLIEIGKKYSPFDFSPFKITRTILVLIFCLKHAKEMEIK